ncbi:MAG TPA: glycosyltransferase family 2 protein [Thermomonospora sp.]|nr:glycosyltransferase family 2 protein [Thermomonospora sp.]
MTTLSVIVPIHNVAPYLRDLLLSFHRNSRDDYQFVFVDDGSQDDGMEVLEAYGSTLPGFTVVRHDTARGLSAARNAGLAVAEGRYITYMDGDDWLGPGHLPAMVEAIDALGCDFVKNDHIRVTGFRRVLTRAPEGRRNTVLKPRDCILPVPDTTMVDYPNAWSGVYRRELAADGLLTFDEELRTCEDRPWTWRLMRHAASFAVVSQSGVFYRRGVGTSLTQIGDERQLHYFDAFDKVLDQLADDPRAHLFRLKALRTYCELIAFHQEKRDRLMPHVQRLQEERAVRTLRAFPPEDVRALLPDLSSAHLEMLRPLLPPEVTR